MKNSIFYKCWLFSYYKGNGLFWFTIFKWGLSFKHIHDYKFTTKEQTDPKGIFFEYWLINLIK